VSSPSALRVGALEHGVEGGDEVVEAHVVVEAVDRLHRQLVGDELADEGERLVGRVRSVAVRGPYLVAVGPADAVAVVAVGDQHVVGADALGDRGDPIRIRHALDDVLDTVDGHRCDRLGRLGEELAQPGRQRQTPDGGEVRLRRPGQVEPVGRCLGGDALVGEHAAGALVDHLETAEHPGDVASGAGGIGEAHPVDRERRPRVVLHDAGVDPLPQRRRRPNVAVGTLRLAGNVDVGDVEAAASAELVEIGVGEHVVGRGDDIVDVPVAVAQGGEGSETGHDDRMPPMGAGAATIER
jgi:hypothetical protein